MKPLFNITLHLLLTFSPFLLFAQFDGNESFHNGLKKMIITCDYTLEELKSIHLNEFGSGDYTYVPASIKYANIDLDSIGIRAKGGITFFDEKTPLKLDFNYFKDQTFDGLKKLNIHQGNNDPTFLRETLSYDILRNAGLKTARTGLIELWFNNENIGIFNAVEQINDDFIKSRFASDKGALYKTGSFGLDEKYVIDNTFPYEDFITTVNQIPTEQLHTELSNYLDVEDYLRFFAAEIFINSVDGPLNVDYNYFMYYEPLSKTYTYVPWDYNLTLYEFADFSLFQESPNFLFSRVLENEILLNQYLHIWCTLLQTSFDKDRLLSMIDHYGMYENEFVNENPNWNEEIINLKTNIALRHQRLRFELADHIDSCTIVSNPLINQEIVINEIMTSNDTTSTITDPNGGHADWIELYNKTSSDIELDQYYLTNNWQIKKQWRFPENTVIKANEYLIIWADRDIDEEGLHTNFKLNKENGYLGLSYENGDLIDSIAYYQNQETNKGFARFPNAIGSFKVQDPTFGSSNGGEVFTVEIKKQSTFFTSPNPVFQGDPIYLQSDYRGPVNLKLLNANGQIIWSQKITLVEGQNIWYEGGVLNQGLHYLFITDDKENVISIQKTIVH